MLNDGGQATGRRFSLSVRGKSLGEQSEEAKLPEGWHNYYTEKRITHQWLQVHLMRDLAVRHVVEIGPHLGVVSALLATAGYRVTTVDIEARGAGIGVERHITADIRQVGAGDLPADADVLLCCETLEHIPWADTGAVLNNLAATKIPWLVLSVPYEGTQIGLQFYWNRYTSRRRSFFRKLRGLKPFPATDPHDWHTHKWEIGYKGYSVETLEAHLCAHGWQPERRDFTDGCRSIFLVCRNSTT